MVLSNVIIGKTQFFINMFIHISSGVYNVSGIRHLLIPSLLSASSPVSMKWTKLLAKIFHTGTIWYNTVWMRITWQWQPCQWLWWGGYPVLLLQLLQSGWRHHHVVMTVCLWIKRRVECKKQNWVQKKRHELIIQKLWTGHFYLQINVNQ